MIEKDNWQTDFQLSRRQKWSRSAGPLHTAPPQTSRIVPSSFGKDRFPKADLYAAPRRQNDAAPLVDFAAALNNLPECGRTSVNSII